MHGEDCATRSEDPRSTHGLIRAERARQCQSPSCVSTDGAEAHGRTLNSRCHRPRRRRERQRRNLFSPTRAKIGGADRDRTDDLKLAKLPLSQLSYGPDPAYEQTAVVGPDRFELSTPRLSSVCSNQLSYGPSPAAVRIPEACVRNWARKPSIRFPAHPRVLKEKRNEDGGEPLKCSRGF